MMISIIFSFIRSTSIGCHIIMIASSAISFSSIVRRQNMTMYAKFFSSIYRSNTNSSKYIRFIVYYFKMFRIYARSISTKVIQLFSNRYFFYKHFVYESMSFISSFIPIKSTITITQIASPYPTVSFFINMKVRKNTSFSFIGNFENHSPILRYNWPIVKHE